MLLRTMVADLQGNLNSRGRREEGGDFDSVRRRDHPLLRWKRDIAIFVAAEPCPWVTTIRGSDSTGEGVLGGWHCYFLLQGSWRVVCLRRMLVVISQDDINHRLNFRCRNGHRATGKVHGVHSAATCLAGTRVQHTGSSSLVRVRALLALLACNAVGQLRLRRANRRCGGVQPR